MSPVPVHGSTIVSAMATLQQNSQPPAAAVEATTPVTSVATAIAASAISAALTTASVAPATTPAAAPAIHKRSKIRVKG